MSEGDLPCRCVVGVSALAGVGYWPLVFLFDCVVGECLAAGVLAIPDGLWGTIGEADHVVLPVRSDSINRVPGV